MVVVSVMFGGWAVTCHVTQACVTRVCSWQSWHGACPVSPGTHQHATCLIMFTLDTPATMFSDWFDICRGSMLLVCSVEQNAFYSVFRCHCEEIEWKNRGYICVCVVGRYLADVWGTHKRFPRAPDLHFSRGHVASCAAARGRDGMNIWLVTCVRRSDPTPQCQY